MKSFFRVHTLLASWEIPTTGLAILQLGIEQKYNEARKLNMDKEHHSLLSQIEIDV